MVSELAFILETHTLVSIFNLRLPTKATERTHKLGKGPIRRSKDPNTDDLEHHLYMSSKLISTNKTNKIQVLKNEGEQHTYEEFFYHPNSSS